MKALIIGATGATGKDLVSILLNNNDYTEVTTFVRRASGLKHPKLKEVITDFDKLEDVSQHIDGDVWFSTLGTTLKDAGSKERQWQIDYEIPAKFATIARRNGIPKAVLLSAYGASTTSKVFYSKMKGDLEAKIAEIGFEQYIIFKPAMLQRKDTDRMAEQIINGLLKFINSIGLAKKFKPMPTTVLAEKMVKAPKALGKGKHIIELDKIFVF